MLFTTNGEKESSNSSRLKPSQKLRLVLGVGIRHVLHNISVALFENLFACIISANIQAVVESDWVLHLTTGYWKPSKSGLSKLVLSKRALNCLGKCMDKDFNF